ncbi:MarR family winged helix-turn-helix transcriptional regulator [Victivallis sp. Marseille-Q1083]|uniref:MarR family winged helix-turn-helix transcriptional regulator n=1 Tax=Victivallis sp. Marseille-Q1083 TaxID=2717288 RepID=UPI00158B1831|nr:MarR family transcriptional regulator [Victivallis sp. Marseille-Q1083]
MKDVAAMRELTVDIYTISRCTHNYYARELRKLHITMGQFPFIMGIVENDGISQEKLSAEIMISKSTTAAIVQQLLNAGLVTREIDPLDRRNFKLHATGKALQLVPKIEESIDRCHEMITGELTEIERDIFARLVKKVRNRTEIILGHKRSGKNVSGTRKDEG